MDARDTLPAPVEVDPAALSADDRARGGIVALPSTLASALEAFTADEVLTATLGSRLVEAITAVRRSEIDLFAAHSPEEVAAATRWAH
jgi:glutamine synthetase